MPKDSAMRWTKTPLTFVARRVGLEATADYQAFPFASLTISRFQLDLWVKPKHRSSIVDKIRAFRKLRPRDLSPSLASSVYSRETPLQ
jgi:hypothetical protein